MPRLNAIMESTRAEIREVLTPEQRERMDTMVPGRRGPRGPRLPGRRAMPVDTPAQPGGGPAPPRGPAPGGLWSYSGR
jgi:hypothetical protein